MPPCTNFLISPDGWTSTAVRPISHSAEVKRRRKAEKSKKERERKKLRKLEAKATIVQPTTTPAQKEDVHNDHEPVLSAGAALVPSIMAVPPSEPDDAQVPTPARPITTEEARMHEEVEPSSSGDAGVEMDREELRKLLFVKVEEELARRQEKTAPAAAAAEAARAAAATAAMVPGTESLLQTPEAFVPPTPLAPLLPYYYYCDPLLDRTAHFAMDCGFYPGVAPVLLQHVVSTVYGAEFASSAVTLSTADVDYMFDIFWTKVVSSYSREEIFFRMTTHPGNGGITRDSGDFGLHIYGFEQKSIPRSMGQPSSRRQYVRLVDISTLDYHGTY